MPFQPEEAGPVLLATVHRILTDHGLAPAHIELAYDGVEDDDTYSMAHHLHPAGHNPGHIFNLATALRSCTEAGSNPGVNGLYIRYFNDGTCVIGPAVIGITGGEGIETEEPDDE